MPPLAVEEIDQRVADIGLVVAEAAGRRRHEGQREIEIGMAGVVAQAGLEARRQIGVDGGAKRAAHAPRRQDRILLGDIAAIGIDRIDRRPAQRRGALHIGKGRGRGIDLNQIDRARGEREAAIDRGRRARRAGARREGGAATDVRLATEPLPVSVPPVTIVVPTMEPVLLVMPAVLVRPPLSVPALLVLPLLVRRPDTVAPALLLKVPALLTVPVQVRLLVMVPVLDTTLPVQVRVVGDAAGIGGDIGDVSAAVADGAGIVEVVGARCRRRRP